MIRLENYNVAKHKLGDSKDFNQINLDYILSLLDNHIEHHSDKLSKFAFIPFSYKNWYFSFEPVSVSAPTRNYGYNALPKLVVKLSFVGNEDSGEKLYVS